jgi:tight adherence protein B
VTLSSAAFGFAAGALGFLGAWAAVGGAAPQVRERAPRIARAAAGLWLLLARAGKEGRDPGTEERRRLLAAGAVVVFLAGAFVGGPTLGAGLAASAPWVVARVLRARRKRYRREVDRGAAAMAMGLADALGGGHSLRGAVAETAAVLPGPAGRELRRTAAELSLGAGTDEALEAMRARVRSPAVDTIVAASLLQRRAGGDLASLLRECARGFEDQRRLDEEVRAATAQARFTGLIVVLLPLGGAALAELASPGYLRELAGSFLTAWLAGLALVMQIIAAVAIRRLGRVRA